MKSLIKLILIVVLPFCFSACGPKSEPEFNASAKFFEAYSLFKEAEKLELNKEDRLALVKLHKALSILNEIKIEDPEWTPLVVEHRYVKIRGAILRLEQHYAQRAFERYLKYKADNSSK